MRTPSVPGRRSDLDILRTLVVVGLVFFHTATVFDLTDDSFYIKNAERSAALTIVGAFVAMWGMPLLMLVSGMSIWHALGRRRPMAFVAERLRRLIVPWIFGVVTLVPFMAYLGERSSGQIAGSYWQFLPTFFAIRPAFDFPWLWQSTGMFEDGHLWFLWVLFVYTLLALPLLLWLRGAAGQRWVERTARLVERPGAVFLPALLVALGEAIGQTEMTGGWNRSVYLLVLIMGFLLAADPRFNRAMRVHAPYALVLALLLFGGVAALFANQMRVGIDPGRGFEPLSVAFRVVKGLDGWMWLIAILGLAGRLVSSGGAADYAGRSQQADRRPTTRLRDLRERLVAYGNEAVLPFYILHEPVVVLIAFFVVPWPTGIALKYLAISVPSLALTLALYELLIRRIGIARFLFGMRPLVREQPGAQPLPA
jgi:Acyltransferase family